MSFIPSLEKYSFPYFVPVAWHDCSSLSTFLSVCHHVSFINSDVINYRLFMRVICYPMSFVSLCHLLTNIHLFDLSHLLMRVIWWPMSSVDQCQSFDLRHLLKRVIWWPMSSVDIYQSFDLSHMLTRVIYRHGRSHSRCQHLRRRIESTKLWVPMHSSIRWPTGALVPAVTTDTESVTSSTVTQYVSNCFCNQWH